MRFVFAQMVHQKNTYLAGVVRINFCKRLFLNISVQRELDYNGYFDDQEVE